MIYILTKRIVISFAVIGLFYAALQTSSTQIFILKRIVSFFTPYEIKSIHIDNNKRFPFETRINELSIGNQQEVFATFKNLSWKISNFSKIILEVSDVSIQSANSEKFDFSKISTNEIADAIHNFTHYMDWFESVTITGLLVKDNYLKIDLRRVNSESILTVSNKAQELKFSLTPLKDYAYLKVSGGWLDRKIEVEAKIRDDSIDFSATSDISAIFDEKIAEFFGKEVVATGRLVKIKEWQFYPLKILTSNGYMIDSNCYVTDSNDIRLSADIKADEKNAAKINMNVSLTPFSISGSADIHIEDLQKFSKPFINDLHGNLSLQAKFDKFSGFEKGSVQVEGQGLMHGKDFYLPINMHVDLNDGLGNGKLDITNKQKKGHYKNYPVEVEAEFNSTSDEINIKKLKLHINDMQIALLKPAQYVWQKGMSSAQLQFCGGIVDLRDLKFSELKEIVNCTINLRGIQLGGLKGLLGQENITGLINGQLKKLPNSPLNIRLDLTQFFWKKQQEKEVLKILSDLSAHFEGNIEDSALTWKLSVSDNDKVTLRGSGNLNTTSYLCDASLKGLLKLNLLTDWLGTGDRIFGDIGVDLHCKGPLDNLIFDGTISADNGLYEHNEVGTFYKDITIRTQARGRKLVITRFDGKDITNSNDPSHGQLKGEGWVDFGDIFSPIFHVVLYLNHLRISQNDSFIGDASGRLLIAGTGAAVNCKGEVTLENAEYFITENPEKMIPGIIDQKIKQTKKIDKNTGTAFPLDILVHAPPGSFKVSGAGANSIWFGDIYVKKSIINPFLVGSVNLHEGTLDVLGKVLKITRGIITFVDDDRNNPRLDIKAVKDLGDGLVVALEVKGTGKDTVLEFTSVPPMAREEVLALLLFGKKLGEVSVLQSIQLAELANSNRSSKKAGFFEKLRSGLGFDQFEFKTTTSGGASENDSDATPAERAAGKTSQAVRIGKEFGKVQVGIEQGAGSETSKLIVSTPLGKNLALQGDVGGAQNSGVGISWIKRY